MKKLFTLMAVLLFLAFSSNTFAQLAKDSWGFGFGVSYPRLTSHNPGIWPQNESVGGFLTIQRNFSEHTALRLQGRFNHISYAWGAGLSRDGNTNLISGNIDFVYTFVPCESVSPYMFAGLGGVYQMYDNPPDPTLDDLLDYQVNLGLGIDIDLSSTWALTAELGIHQVPNTSLDGQYGTGLGGIFGATTDAYMTFNLGLMYTFSKGEPSKYCQLYDGISADVPEIDYERIENIVKKHIPKEVVKEVVVERPMDQKWILVGVNFDFNKATLRSESYPVLFHAVQVLLQNPDMRVEIQGHTDNIGSDDYNMKLGERRAKTVKDYLVARGISADRLSVRSFGESQPIADNKTADGRAINRRVEFKVLN
ncbi:MAG TPA: OmpA family protein [Ignavibacteria bacterium]|nr:OmpA family protein [Ignavibacteria bacterium]